MEAQMNPSKQAIEAAMHDIFVAMTEENTEGQRDQIRAALRLHFQAAIDEASGDDTKRLDNVTGQFTFTESGQTCWKNRWFASKRVAIDTAIETKSRRSTKAESRPAQEKCPRCEGTRLIQTSDGVTNCPNCNAESRPAQEVDEVGKQIVLEIYRNIKTEEEAKAAIEAHKIKAEDTPS